MEPKGHHDHPPGVSTGSGEIKITFQGKVEVVSFANGEIFLDTKKDEEEQRICLHLEQQISYHKVTQLSNPFVKLRFDKPVFSNNIPIKSLTIFLLSATISCNRMDALISPPNKYLDPLIRPDYRH